MSAGVPERVPPLAGLELMNLLDPCTCAIKVRDAINAAGYFGEADVSDRKLQKRIREAQLAQFNYILVVGEDETTKKLVNIRTRDDVVHGTKSLPELLADFEKETALFH